MRRLILPALACTLLLAAPTLRAEDEPAKSKPDFAARLEQLVEKLETARSEHHVPGMALAVVKDDRVVLTRGFGLRDVEKRRPVEPGTIFAIGSTTKAFTTALIGMLVDEGRMTWDDPVRKHLPYFELRDKDADSKVTIRDLLCHRTGLTRMGLLWAGNKVSREMALRHVRLAELYAPFRTRFLYNNVMYLAAGEASARAAGSSWDALLEKRIFDPLGMTHAHTDAERLKTEPAAARGYIWDEDENRYEPQSVRSVETAAPAGAINASVVDMAKWIRFLLAGGSFQGRRLLGPAQHAEAWKSQMTLGPGVGYGLGWFLRTWKGRRVVAHGGNIDGYCAMVALLPEENLGYVLLSNVSASPLQGKSQALVWETLLGEPGQLPAESKAWPKAKLEPLVGKYDLSQLGVEATVLINKKGRLAIDIPGQMVFVLHWPDARGRWVFEYSKDIELEFAKPVDGRVPALTLHQKARADLTRVGGPGPKVLGKREPGAPWTREALRPLVGTYLLAAAGQKWKIAAQDGALTVQVPGQSPASLRWPDAEGRWIVEPAPAQSLRFVTNDAGAVTGVKFVNQIVLKAPRAGTAKDLGFTLADLQRTRAAQVPDKADPKPLPAKWRFEGTIHFVHQGVWGLVEGHVDGAERWEQEMDFGYFGSIRTVLDGKRAWVESDIQSRDQPKGKELEQLWLEHPFKAFGDWTAGYARTELIGKEKYAGEDVAVVRCVPPTAPATKKYVSLKTGMVVKEERPMIAKGIGTVTVKLRFGDHRFVGGLWIPMRQEMKSNWMGKVVVRLTTAEPVEALAAGVFERSAPPR